ncbi:Para-hydroxybenzoate--polyprenyltransferase, mitochondrial precursor (PHB:polyprenyltransferase) [Friedmanniomyces endolithicus]|uniref:4-hydroxybenzoate polyprenyltransferase, mitochondrial n=1 Tax=Friedmanniomyces endolithicus TaxID=329885 RepID=A0AAN6J581_9PEZI|nr:Para-hydroxybenzoate--polyprenyltransferase, mitochondrial precursor (PHB:polyprenyltransferase) [Friedmanniomyces endolithicus]KAK0281124.1 Para-hydroxybenzoate--polyprenyltransferase, mitochondrial precursor (PHB:polyprenyltransferase) [Friedmanniomyces endolithicus]KAK0295086.1 Para-hydroxybenzoate--polyprenyltransferase, mitochondrial precursor (PHB:polyprenyltransferase) [Friedmanniomyces endolithicus]KAK0313809.1 Para-hydroxybenzoate--polyprenyltransferase, mitochondrial precursor (PHB:
MSSLIPTLRYAARRRWTTSRRLADCASSGRVAQFVSRPTTTCPAAQRRCTATTSSTPKPPILPAEAIVEDSQPEIYRPPTTGLLARVPSSWVPYGELIRLDKPAGTYYLYFPCLFGTLLAAPYATPLASPFTVLYTSSLFFAGAIIMRGAGCTINDLWDRNLDPHVTRTRLRPIARGAISVQQAIAFLGAQLLAGLAVLLQFPSQCFFYATPSLLLVALYPLAKRVTNYPQFVLGLTFSWGAFLGFPALSVDLLADTPALISAACLYGSCIAWTLVYDMIYAFQDIRDDPKAGIKSIALAQQANAKNFLMAASAVQVGLLVGAGASLGVGPVYYFLTCGGAAATLDYMIREVNLESVEDCAEWFRKGAWITGGAISVGLFVEYLVQYFDLFGDQSRKREAMKA